MNSPMFCFSGDMEIETYEGTKKMKDLKIDEYVQAFPSYVSKFSYFLYNHFLRSRSGKIRSGPGHKGPGPLY